MTDTELVDFLGKQEGHIPHRTRGTLNDLLYHSGDDIREILTRCAEMHAKWVEEWAKVEARILHEKMAPVA